MMNHRKARMGKSTDFGIPQVGKGDSERIADRAEFNRNFDAIEFPSVNEPDGFKKYGKKIIKKYS